jgi:uncharacterized membrane protein (UPF0127 family)
VTSRDSTRRTHLRRVGAALAAVGVAGCSAGDDTETDPTDTAAATDESTGTDAATAADTPTAETSTTATETTTTETTASDSDQTTARPTTDPLHPGYDYDTTDVVAETPAGERLGSVTAAISDTPEKRFTGLSDTDSLPEDRGMLFVYEEVGDLTYVMRRMSFGIDIVYADDEGVITRIHHAPEPGPGEDGNEQEYPGRGQYVLEVNLDWTTRHGVEEGDVLDFEL